MEDIIVFILLFFIIISLTAGTIPPFTQKAEISQSQETVVEQEPLPEKETPLSETTETQPSQEVKTYPQQIKPKVLVDTYIVSGPEEGEIIGTTNQVTFGFDAKVSPEQAETWIIFETKIEGFDSNWVSTWHKERIIILPPGPQKYTFSVRAKINEIIDPTPARRTFVINTSPYFDKVRISSVQPKTSYYPSLITLSTYLENKGKINITGWQLKGSGGTFTIPTGIEKYLPGYNSVPTESIFIEKNDMVYLSGSLNPFGSGRNFRPNKCLGYLAYSRDFPIPLSRNCPIPKREEISHLHPYCQEFILWLGQCNTPDHSNNFRVSSDSECVSYLNENLNYGGCFRNYSQDEDFIENSWHIYMDSEIVVSNDCDALYLLDQNGLLIDKYSYGYPVCRW